MPASAACCSACVSRAACRSTARPGLTVTDNTFAGGNLVVSGGTDLQIVHNVLAIGATLRISSAASGIIAHNVMANTGGVGLQIDAAFTGAIRDNDIAGNLTGVSYNAAAELVGNRIFGNTTGVRSTVSGSSGLRLRRRGDPERHPRQRHRRPARRRGRTQPARPRQLDRHHGQRDRRRRFARFRQPDRRQHHRRRRLHRHDPVQPHLRQRHRHRRCDRQPHPPQPDLPQRRRRRPGRRRVRRAHLQQHAVHGVRATSSGSRTALRTSTSATTCCGRRAATTCTSPTTPRSASSPTTTTSTAPAPARSATGRATSTTSSTGRRTSRASTCTRSAAPTSIRSGRNRAS